MISESIGLVLLIIGLACGMVYGYFWGYSDKENEDKIDEEDD